MIVDRATARDAGALAEILPAALRDAGAAAGPMAGLLDAMTALSRPRAEAIDAGLALFAPDATPERFLPWLADWLGYGWLFLDPKDPRRRLTLAEGFPPGADRLRAFLSAWPELHARRATAEGLRRGLEVATGRDGFTVLEDPASLRLTVVAPRDTAAMRPWLARLIAAERPAHMTWALTLDGDAA